MDVSNDSMHEINRTHTNTDTQRQRQRQTHRVFKSDNNTSYTCSIYNNKGRAPFSMTSVYKYTNRVNHAVTCTYMHRR